MGLEKIGELLGEMKAPVKECYLVSDAQAITWGEPSERARQALNQAASLGRVFFLPVTTDQAENVAVTRLELQSGLLRKGQTARYVAEVRNMGNRPREGVSVGLYVNNVRVDQRVLERLQPGQSASVPLFARFDREGIMRLSARVGDDELAADNARHAVAVVRGQTRVLYAHAPSVEGAEAEEKDYILTALAPRPGGSLTVDDVSWLELPNKRFSEYQVVIISNVPDLPPEVARNLFHFVRQGGGLIVFAGDAVQPVVFNAVMTQGGESLLPGKLVESAKPQAAGETVEVEAHPLSRVLGNFSQDILKEARVYRHLKLELGAGGRVALRLSGGDPLLAEKQVGRGGVVLFTAAADRRWTNMVVEPGFYPLLLHEAITRLGRQVHERPFTVSETLALPLPASDGASAIKVVTVRDPAGRSSTLPAVLRDGQTFAEVSRAEQPGFYELKYADDAPPLVAAVNVAAEESDVKTLHGAALAQALEGTSVRVVEETSDLGEVVREGRVGRELWKELLLAALAVLLLESFLAYWFTRRMSATREPLAA